VGSQIAGTRSRRDSSASTQASILSVLQANGARPLTFCAVGDLDLPARQLQLVMHEPGAVHRLDRRMDRAAEPADPVGQHRQPGAVRRGRGHRQSCARLVHHVNIQPRSTQVQPHVHHDNRPPSDTLSLSVPRGEAPGFMTFIH
jgi:hypothetical protein